MTTPRREPLHVWRVTKGPQPRQGRAPPSPGGAARVTSLAEHQEAPRTVRNGGPRVGAETACTCAGRGLASRGGGQHGRLPLPPRDHAGQPRLQATPGLA